jgi:hypothetical protein
MALSLLAGLLGLLILAYWVGYSRGGSAAEERAMAIYEPHNNGVDRVPPNRLRAGAERGALGGVSAASEGTSGRGYSQVAAGQGADPRTAGLNYLILATSPEEDAWRLKKFFSGRGVDVMVSPRNNRGLCQVIVLGGITPQQYGDKDVRERILTPMRALGRDWKASNGGKGDDLSSMYYEKYKPGG